MMKNGLKERFDENMERILQSVTVCITDFEGFHCDWYKCWKLFGKVNVHTDDALGTTDVAWGK